MASVSARSVPGRIVLSCVPWKTYLRALRTFEGRHLRITYDRGELEIMTLSHKHESISYFLGRMVDALTEELGLPIHGGGRTTFKRRLKKKGLEPDNCYWIAHEAAVRNKDKIDLRVDPAPDLGLEVDITRSSLSRLGIYTALQVPEVWRFKGTSVVFHILQPNGKHKIEPVSRVFLGLRSDDLTPFLQRFGTTDINTLIRDFRAWVRQRIAAGWK